MVARLRSQGVTNEVVLAAMGVLPREIFVDEALRMRVYDDCSLPIGQGQTLSQPFIVARMTELLLAAPRPVRRVLEIGTGSGYQSAVLAACGLTVFTVERIGSFLERARARHAQCGALRVRTLHQDGFGGWPSQAPFDGILVTAAPEAVPDALVAQLAVGGRLLVPVGAQGAEQRLCCVTRTATGVTIESLDQVSFVPLLPGEMR
ncbi:protein-L-isoaspartate(D-aspartate) O-methyltransferase [Halothiobacillus sp. DCM-1]|uniref:protein-L-isoaspartate(D-aspartate) O-methyltransferase n=1 Tax=Halothiobacillus sp. DCM-1 TaxID=3112558 RepID=UPI003254948D